MHPLLNIAINAAREVGPMLRRAQERLDELTTEEKNPHDFVTQMDKAAESEIIHAIQNVYPNHKILAEESGYQNNPGEITWIIDPIDGTTNFIHGIPHFAISIAIQEKDKITHGIVYDPMKEELFHASRGRGAYVNNYRIRVTSVKNLEQALLGTGFPIRQKNQLANYLKTFEAIFTQCAGIRRAGAAALDLAYVAAGRLDGFWEGALQPWDMAAGSLLIKEAGGLVTDFQGTEDFLKKGQIIAANPKLLKLLIPFMQKRSSED